MVARLRLVTTIFALWLAFCLLARLGFYLYQPAITLSPWELLAAFGAGLRLDLSSAAYLTVVPLAAVALTCWGGTRVARSLFRVWTMAAIAAASLIVVADLEIFKWWDRRIDASVIPYLATPVEAWASAGASPRVALIALVAVLAAVAWLAFRTTTRSVDRLTDRAPFAVIPLLAVLGLLFLAGRGGTGTWPLTVSSAYHSANPRANAVAENAMWGFFDSVYRRLYDRSNPYIALPAAQAADAITSARTAEGPTRPRPFTVARPNLLLIVWESASARVFGALGGLSDVTPGFDSLAERALLFRRFYAAGDRTDKGLVALLSAFPGVPRGSIATVPRKTRNLPSLQATLERSGYTTAFYYGGDLEFASLKAYLTNTGFDRVVGKDTFPRSARRSKWGAHDSVVAARVLADLDAMPRPFFTVWLTLSSHEPFEIPGDPAPPGEDWLGGFRRSMRYSDRIITALIREAATRPWWDETVVVIVSDHGRRVVPLDANRVPRDPEAESHVPMLWLGGAVDFTSDLGEDAASQLDLTPTLLAALGHADSLVQRDFPFGRSLLTPITRPYGYLGFDEGFGIVTADGALVYDHRAHRDLLARGNVTATDRALGQALLQLSYQQYLDR